ncbi:MAG TPA: hypothetical protein VH331_02745 [Allosphingosinicella sp.]|jgi:hypothetical protein|nr:hypothetical protein [Allosphingosinicella sp.]
MLKKALRLFVIKNRFEAWAVIYAVALGAMTRGTQYLQLYPGAAGWVLFAACSGAVFMAGAKILDGTRPPAYRHASLSRITARARRG